MISDPKELSAVIGETAPAIEDIIRQAFEAGRAVGRREASGELRERLMRVVDMDLAEADGAPQGEGEISIDDDVLPGRAAPGSVKPIILALVRKKPGLTTAEIQKETGVKFNSARGTLWTLSQELTVERRLGKWFPREQTNEAAGSPEESGPAASSFVEVPRERVFG